MARELKNVIDSGEIDENITNAVKRTNIDVSDVDGLETELAGKAGVVHNHYISDIQNLQDELNGKEPSLGLGQPGYVLATNIDANGKEWVPMTGSGGSVYWGDILGTLGSQTDLQDALDAKADAVSGPDNMFAALDGTGQLKNSGYSASSFSGASHTHQWSEITGLQSELDKKVDSDTSLVPGSELISNIVSLTQAEYNALTPDANTLYIIVG